MNQTSNLLQPQTDTTTAAPGGDPGSAGVHPNSDAALVVAITDHQQRLDDWAIVGQRKRFDLARAARVMHGWIKSLRTELIPPTWPGGGAIEHPPVLLTFSRLRRNVLGHFKPGRNEQSLRGEVGLNPRAMLMRSDAQTAAVLLHELLHVCEAAAGAPPKLGRGYHSAAFRGLAEQLGIPCTKHGHEMGVVPGSTFHRWAAAQGLSFGDCSFVIHSAGTVTEATQPKAKRVQWACACGIKAWVPRATPFEALCMLCNERFRRTG
ncbi:MAG TPA: hypothetical protein VJN18_11445 [Polyangiaceae bacterium]|nr:hypothetical protein [Polyangiaceae bacterium]